MKTELQIKTWEGIILFEYECEDNTIKKTLEGAVRAYANLTGANLAYADLTNANLAYANLAYADLTRTNLAYANLTRAKNADHAIAQTVIVPEGSFTAWKLCRENILVKLLIPEDAKRSNASGRKCRAEKAQVLELIDLTDKRKKPQVAISQHDEKTEYREGETVVCDKWDENRWEECSGGIHFFITRLEAENYK